MSKSSRAGARRAGQIVIISSPSGGGKTTICKRLLSPTRRKEGWRFSVSYTTRPRRTGERHGVHYWFVNDAQFDAMDARGLFAEACKVHLYRYATPRAPLDQALKDGGVIILDVDVQGARKLKAAYPGAVTIFVLPPSVAELRRRLKRRGTETAEQLRVRFENARRELALWPRFEYAVVNERIDEAVRDVLHIIASHPLRAENRPPEQFRSGSGSER